MEVLNRGVVKRDLSYAIYFGLFLKNAGFNIHKRLLLSRGEDWHDLSLQVGVLKLAPSSLWDLSALISIWLLGLRSHGPLSTG